MPIVGLLLGIAVGVGTRAAESAGHRWVLLVTALAVLGVSVVGFINGLSRPTAAALAGIAIGYGGFVLAALVRGRRRPSI